MASSNKQFKSSNFVDNLYRSRKTLIQYLENEGFNCEGFKEFSLNDINTMNTMKSLDILVEQESGTKAFVKYHLEGTLRNSIYEYIDELYNVEELLTKKDNFVIILNDKPNDSITQIVRSIYERDGIFITLMNIKHLLFNVLEHKMVPHHRKLTNEEKTDIYQKYNITGDNEIPEISRFDPVANAIFMRPGELCEITRYNKTSIREKYYRICISQ